MEIGGTSNGKLERLDVIPVHFQIASGQFCKMWIPAATTSPLECDRKNITVLPFEDFNQQLNASYFRSISQCLQGYAIPLKEARRPDGSFNLD